MPPQTSSANRGPREAESERGIPGRLVVSLPHRARGVRASHDLRVLGGRVVHRRGALPRFAQAEVELVVLITRRSVESANRQSPHGPSSYRIL